MKQLINAWLAIMFISTLYGWYVIEFNQMGLFSFFVMMAIFDSILISHIEKLPTTDTTILFMAVLVMSILVHTIGAINWLAYNQNAPYIACKLFVLLLEILVITGGGIGGYINRRSQARRVHYLPCIINIMENKTCH